MFPHVGLAPAIWAPFLVLAGTTNLHDLVSGIASLNYLAIAHACTSAPRRFAKCLSIALANIQWQTSTRIIAATAGPIFVQAAFTKASNVRVTLNPADTEEVPFASRAFAILTTLLRTSIDLNPIHTSASLGDYRHPKSTRNDSSAPY